MSTMAQFKLRAPESMSMAEVVTWFKGWIGQELQVSTVADIGIVFENQGTCIQRLLVRRNMWVKV